MLARRRPPHPVSPPQVATSQLAVLVLWLDVLLHETLLFVAQLRIAVANLKRQLHRLRFDRHRRLDGVLEFLKNVIILAKHGGSLIGLVNACTIQGLAGCTIQGLAGCKTISCCCQADIKNGIEALHSRYIFINLIAGITLNYRANIFNSYVVGLLVPPVCSI